jgi:protein-disulfide isomerase
MLLNRNSSCNNSKGCNWFFYIAVIGVISLAVFGGRDKIKSHLREFASIDKSEIEKVVGDYIKANPQAIIDSVQDLKKREYEESMKQAQMKIHENKDSLQGKGSDMTTFAGNKDGDVVIVTFLDYRCGYCKRTNSDLKELIKKDPNVKIIFKEFPILGPQSQALSKTALAVQLIDKTKYMDFHNALMDSPQLDDKSVDVILTKLNLDVAKVKAMMNDERVQKELDSIATLARQLEVRGTPAFIIDEELIPGAIELNSLMAKIKDLREKNKGK